MAVPHPGDDSILPFQLDRSAMRGRVARLDGALDAILGRRDWPAPVAALVATDYFAPESEGEPARMRAWAGFDAEAVAAAGAARPFELVAPGVVGVTIDQGPDMAPYQGITPLAGGSLAASVETYFAQSEQIATRFAVAAALASSPGEPPAWRGGGVMIQQLPGEGGRIPDAPSGAEGLMSAEDVAGLEGREEDWGRVALLLATVETHELIGPHVAPESLLVRLFHEESPRVWPPQPVRFGCTCSAEKVEDALAGSRAEELRAMTKADGMIGAECQFCGAAYAIDPAALREGARS